MAAAATTMSIADAMTLLSGSNALERAAETLGEVASNFVDVRLEGAVRRDFGKLTRRILALGLVIRKEVDELQGLCWDAQVVIDENDPPPF